MAVAAALTLSAAITVVVAVVSKIRISLTWYVTRALLRCLANHFSCCIATASAGSGACQGSLFSPACLDLRTVVLLAPRQSGLLTLPSLRPPRLPLRRLPDLRSGRNGSAACVSAASAASSAASPAGLSGRPLGRPVRSACGRRGNPMAAVVQAWLNYGQLACSPAV